MSRYSRQILLDEIGNIGQQRLQASRVLIVGVGGLGCPVLQYLAGAGVGFIHLVDHDVIELNNLQRQVIFTEQDVGSRKTAAAQKRIQQLNSDCQITVTSAAFDTGNAENLLKKADMIIDCCDDLYTKYLLNDYCHWQQKPLVSASLFKFHAQIACYQTAFTPCMRCVFPASATIETPSCESSGMLGAVASVAGSLQALEVIRWIIDAKTSLRGHLLSIDLTNYQITRYTMQKDRNCPLCSLQKPVSQLIYPEKVCPYRINQEQFRQQQKTHRFTLIDVRTPVEHQKFNLGGINIPLADLPEKLDLLDREHKYLLYCQSGKRSQQAVMLLRSKHFNHSYSLQDGLISFKSS